MRPFRYHAPETIADAVALLAAAPGASSLMAGGTDLLVQMRRGARTPDHVIDIKRIRKLHTLVFSEDNGLTFGAAVPCARLCEAPEVVAHYPGLVDAFSLIGGVATQGRATIGGNIGNAAPSADSVSPLIVHGATCTIAGPSGSRTVPVDRLCLGPGKTALEPGEIITTFHVPPPRPGAAGAYLRFTPRGEMDIAVAGAAAWLQIDDGVIAGIQVALTAVAPRPLPVPAIPTALIGKPPTEAVFQHAGELAAAAATPISDHRGTAAQRRHLTRVLTIRTLETAIARIESPSNPSSANP